MPGKLRTNLLIWSLFAVAGTFAIDIGLNYVGWANTPGAAIEAAFTTGLLMLLFYIANRLVMRPLREVEDAADRVRAGDLSARVHITSSKEMAALSDTLNSMMERLAESYVQLTDYNITLEKTVEDRTLALSVERDKLQAMLMSIPEGVVFISITGEIKEANPVFGDIWGMKPEDIVGVNVEKLPEGALKDALTYSKTDRAPSVRCWEAFNCMEKNCPAYMSDDARCWLVSGTFCRKGVQTSVKKKREEVCSQCEVFKEAMEHCGEIREVNVGGRHYKVGGALVLDDKQKVLGEIKTFYDFTQEKLLERRKADFVSMVTHDLKSPLTSILGYSDLLLSGGVVKLSGESEEFVRSMKGSGKRLLDMVEQYLDLTKIEAGVFELKKLPVPPGQLIDEAIPDMAYPAREKDIEISVDVKPGLPDVEVDRAKMVRVVTNLISNAIKFTPEGGKVLVSAVETQGRDGADIIEISVSDTGPGIHPDDLPNIFDPYFRSSSSSNIKGTGLGLAVVKSIVTAHGGEVIVDARPGTGSRFTIRLPIKATPAQDGAAQ